MKKISFIIALMASLSLMASCGTRNNNGANTTASPVPTHTATADNNTVGNDVGNAVEGTGNAVGDVARDAGNAVGNAVEGTTRAVGDVVR